MFTHHARNASTWKIIFFFNDTATTEIYTLSLHDALPISSRHDVPAAPIEQYVVLGELAGVVRGEKESGRHEASLTNLQTSYQRASSPQDNLNHQGTKTRRLGISLVPWRLCGWISTRRPQTRLLHQHRPRAAVGVVFVGLIVRF